MIQQRVLSAAMLAPPALAAVWFGGYAFAAAATIVAAVMVKEWFSIVRGDTGWATVAAAATGAACLAAFPYPAAGVVIVLAVALASLVVSGRAWVGFGILYAGLPNVALVWLRGDGDAGRNVLIWLFLVVWATDTAAYAAGRMIGGPLLMPAVSPKKTWAGLTGGILAAAAVGWKVAELQGFDPSLVLLPACGALAVIEQAGDLLESWVKRQWGVKDASNLIPGHGGVMDRVDGLLAAGSILAVGKLAWNPAIMNGIW